MRDFAYKKRIRVLSGIVLALALMLLMGAIAQADSSSVNRLISPTTGLETESKYRPVVVVINNSKESRPQWGLSQADIIYEMIYWGPIHTRYLAVFNDQLPTQAGPVRGARVYDVELAEGYGAVLAHRGGQSQQGTDIYDAMLQFEMVSGGRSQDGVRGSRFFLTSNERINPHNTVVNVDAIVQKAWPDGSDGEPYEPEIPGFAFGEATPSGMTATEIRLLYSVKALEQDGRSVYRPSFRWSAENGFYERYQNGERMTDWNDDTAIIAHNVIVAEHQQSYYENTRSRPVIETVGTGRMTAFIAGNVYDGYWESDGAGEAIRYRLSDGSPLVLSPGKTFIQIVPSGMFEAVSIKEGVYTFENTVYELDRAGAAGLDSVSPSTGMAAEKPYRPVLAVIDGDVKNGRKYGISDADVIYEMSYAANMTRLTAVFSDEHPSRVGPLATPRLREIAMGSAWDGVIAARMQGDGNGSETQKNVFSLEGSISGMAVTKVAGENDPGNGNDTDSGTESDERWGVIYRAAVIPVASTSDEDGEEAIASCFFALVNGQMMLNAEKLASEGWPSAGGQAMMPRESGLRFGDEPTHGASECYEIVIRFDGSEGNESTFRYDEHGYARSDGGKPMIDENNGEAVIVSNVIVAETTFSDNSDNDILSAAGMTGNGRIAYFIGGTAGVGTWACKDASEPIRYMTENEQELILRPGKTFILHVSEAMLNGVSVEAEKMVFEAK